MKIVVYKWETCVNFVKVLKNSHSNFNINKNSVKNNFFLSTCNSALTFHSKTPNNYSFGRTIWWSLSKPKTIVIGQSKLVSM